MKRTLVLGIVVVAGLCIAAVAAQQRGAGVGAIQKVAEDVYFIPGAGGNTGVYVAAGGVVLVDTKNPNNGQAILDQVRTVTNRPVTMIINTHTHGDHNGSNVFFPESVEIVAHENTATNMQRMEIFQQPANRHGLPDRTFGARLTVLSGNDAIDLYHFGPAHTDGDAFVVFRNRRVMHAGDVFPNKQQPFIDTNNGGSGVAFGETVGSAANAISNVDTVIAGHSPSTMTWQDFVTFGEFNRLMAEHARASMKQGRSAEEAMKTFMPGARFGDYDLSPGRGGAAGNFATLYQELQQ